MPREASRVTGAVTGINGDTVLTSPVRRERVKRSKKELAEEAAQVIRQADKIGCIASNDKGIPNCDLFLINVRPLNLTLLMVYQIAPYGLQNALLQKMICNK